MRFKLWLENIEAKRKAMQDTLVNFLKDELNITDDEIVLQMSTTDIDRDVINKLNLRGIISTSSPYIQDAIKNGVTIEELAGLLASDDTKDKVPSF